MRERLSSTTEYSDTFLNWISPDVDAAYTPANSECQWKYPVVSLAHDMSGEISKVEAKTWRQEPPRERICEGKPIVVYTRLKHGRGKGGHPR